MRHALACCVVLGSLLAITWLECRAKSLLCDEYRRRLDELAVVRIAGNLEERRYAAAVLAARARVAIAELRSNLLTDKVLAPDIRILLGRIDEALR